jgi:zinc protease
MSTSIHRQLYKQSTLITLSDASLPLVRFVVASRKGAYHDPIGQAGLGAQVLEMTLRGSASLNRRDFNMRLEGLGSAVSAQGGSSYSLLRGVCLKRFIDETFDLVCEAILKPAHAPEQQRRLRDELEEEILWARDDDSTLASILMRQHLYPKHVFGRSLIGEISDLNKIDSSDISRHHSHIFAADDVILMFSGDITPEKSLSLAEKLLPHLVNPTTPLPSPQPPSSQKGQGLVLVDKPDRTQVQMRVGTILCDAHNPTVFPLWLGLVAFGGIFTGPLCAEVRDKRGWSYGVGLNFDRRSPTSAPMVIHSASSTKDALNCVKLVMGMLEGLARGELSDEHLDQARNYLINCAPFQLATSSDMMGPILRCEFLGLSLDEVHTYPDQLKQTSNDQVRKALVEHLSERPLATLMVAPAETFATGLERAFPNQSIRNVFYRSNLDLP